MCLPRLREKSEGFAEGTVCQTAQMVDAFFVGKINGSVNEIRNVKYPFVCRRNRNFSYRNSSRKNSTIP